MISDSGSTTVPLRCRSSDAEKRSRGARPDIERLVARRRPTTQTSARSESRPFKRASCIAADGAFSCYGAGAMPEIPPETPDAGTVELDLSGLKCPLPALRTRKALRGLAPGARLAVTCTDPLAGIDIPNVVREEGAALEAQERHGPVSRFLIRPIARADHSPS